MNEKRSKIVVTACGGCATNIVDKAIKFVSQEPGFAELEFHFFDTSRANYDNIEPVGDFFQVTRKASSAIVGGNINGSGGDKTTHARDIIMNVPDYLAKIKTTKKETGVYHLLVSSAGGGTGALSLIAIADELMAKDIPVICVLVGDNSSALRSRNTQTTLASLSAKAVARKKCLLVYYLNNSYMGAGITANENAVNDKILNGITVLSAFLSGQNEAIDETDMENFIDQSKFKTINIVPGIYTLSFHSKDDVDLGIGIPTIARTLTVEGTDVNFNLEVFDYKVGKIVKEEAIAKFGSMLPTHLVASNGVLKGEIEKLTEINAKASEIQKNMVNYNIQAPEDVKVDDDLGIMF